MTVIAKLSVNSVVEFGTGTFALLGCICENDLMAAYNPSEEDKLFTRYSPWGEMRLNQRQNWAVFTKQEDVHVEIPNSGAKAFYVVLLTEDEIGDAKFEGASAFIKVNCYSKSKFAGDGSRVELREIYTWKNNLAEIDADRYGRSRGGVIEKLSWKMHVDNPSAEAGFVPGQDYWVAFYDADEFDMRGAIFAAQGIKAPRKTEKVDES